MWHLLLCRTTEMLTTNLDRFQQYYADNGNIKKFVPAAKDRAKLGAEGNWADDNGYEATFGTGVFFGWPISNAAPGDFVGLDVNGKGADSFNNFRCYRGKDGDLYVKDGFTCRSDYYCIRSSKAAT